MWLTRYADVALVLRDPRFSSSPSALGDDLDMSKMSPVRQIGSSLMMYLDPPDHTRLRGLVSQAFTPREVEALRPRAQQLVEGLIDTVIERDDGQLDVLVDLAHALPSAMICELLGVPNDDRGRMKEWADGCARLMDGHLLDPAALTEAMDARRELMRYFAELIEDRRRAVSTGILNTLIEANADGDRLSGPELLTTIVLLFLAGFETTMNLIGNGTLALLRNPDQMARLRDDPSLLRSAVEELLRYDPPVPTTVRVAATDVEIDGLRIRRGEQVTVSLAAANRDPDQFPDPDRLDVSRSPNRHLALGSGPHFCLGAALARIEAQVTFGAMLRRFSRLELITENPIYRDHFVMRGLKELKVAWTRDP